ncbi:MAG: response regulator [Nitrospirae bacterium]|nr:response regulator [Nitrospirota bacterium]MBF0540476.1 response regulator [Nitrospirota bacterium]
MEASEILKQTTILFVEDDLIVRMALVKFLKRRCKGVIEAENGRIALELFIEHRPDVVITDLEMPVMGGLELIDRIIEYDDKQAIIITTAYDDLKHKHSKVRAHLIKPIDSENLLETIISCRKK